MFSAARGHLGRSGLGPDERFGLLLNVRHVGAAAAWKAARR
jgi:hypothetical protein